MRCNELADCLDFLWSALAFAQHKRASLHLAIDDVGHRPRAVDRFDYWQASQSGSSIAQNCGGASSTAPRERAPPA